MKTTLIQNEQKCIKLPVDEISFSDFYDDFFPKVYNYVRYRVNDPYIADDLTSLIFLRIIDKLNTYNPQKGNISTWVFTIANNIVVDHYRTHSHYKTVSGDVLNNIIEHREDIENIIVDKELKDYLLEAITQLPERERNIIALKFWSETNNREIAKLTGLTESNVGVILFRSIRKLRNILEQQGVSLNE